MIRRIHLLLILLAGVNLVIPAANVRRENQRPRTPPEVRVSPAGLEFGSQVVKRASKPKRLTVTNTGGRDLYINSVVLGGDHQQDFVLSNDTCTGATIRTNRSCVVDVVFVPSAKDKRNAILTLTDNAIDSPQTVRLSGDGINSADVPPNGPGREN